MRGTLDQQERDRSDLESPAPSPRLGGWLGFGTFTTSIDINSSNHVCGFCSASRRSPRRAEGIDTAPVPCRAISASQTPARATPAMHLPGKSCSPRLSTIEDPPHINFLRDLIDRRRMSPRLSSIIRQHRRQLRRKLVVGKQLSHELKRRQIQDPRRRRIRWIQRRHGSRAATSSSIFASVASSAERYASPRASLRSARRDKPSPRDASWDRRRIEAPASKPGHSTMMPMSRRDPSDVARPPSILAAHPGGNPQAA